MTKREQFIKYANEVKALGYRVFVTKESNGYCYGYVVNEKDEIGYFQLGDYGYGLSFSTIHHGTKLMGRGFCLDEWDKLPCEFTREIVDRCFVRVPSWCYQKGWYRTKEERKALDNIKKYKASEYLSSLWNKDDIEEL